MKAGIAIGAPIGARGSRPAVRKVEGLYPN